MPQIQPPVEPPPVIRPPEQSWTPPRIVTREDIAAAEREGRRRKGKRAAIIAAAVGGYAIITLVAAVLSPEIYGPVVGLPAILAVALAIYFTPAIVAHRRGHANAEAITVLNFALGWTFVGWAVALVWAHTRQGI